jgi:hypothetical protein
MTHQDKGAVWSFNKSPDGSSQKYRKPQGKQSDVPEVSNRYVTPMSASRYQDTQACTHHRSPSV